ncbi:hypothetical protein KB1_21770 [Cutibacterium modestum]|uniref:Uncharacterized protein n=1 Tax=Cutibacterium modestum TaxID=2559073 RepID=A0AAD1KQZ4_9ACTN|nr:hypothetical protein KB1_21770 [Cutibacterium modestum]
MSRSLNDNWSTQLVGLGVLGSVDNVGPKLLSHRQLVFVNVDGDNATAFAGSSSGKHGCHPHPSQSDAYHIVLGRGLSGVDNGTTAGEHRASEHSGNFGRNLIGYRNQGLPPHNGMGGESRNAKMMADCLVIPVQSDATTEQRAGNIGLTSRDAR